MLVERHWKTILGNAESIGNGGKINGRIARHRSLLRRLFRPRALALNKSNAPGGVVSGVVPSGDGVRGGVEVVGAVTGRMVDHSGELPTLLRRYQFSDGAVPLISRATERMDSLVSSQAKSGADVFRRRLGRSRLMSYASCIVSLLGLVSCTEEAGNGPSAPDAVAASLTLAPEALTMTAVGETSTLRARVLDMHGQVVSRAPVMWGARDSFVASVDAGGLVTAVGHGTTQVTAALGRLADHATVTVAQQAVRLHLSPAADTLRTHGDTLRLTADGADANGHPIPPHAFLWSTSNTSVIAVDTAGLVTATGNGTAFVSVTSGDMSATVEVTVYDLRAAVAQDRSALMTLFEATRGDRWRNESNRNWGGQQPLSTWAGVSVGDDGRVTALALRANGLFGTLPPELGALERLTALDLESNPNLTCPIPRELGNLHALESLSLKSTLLLACPVPPELGRLTNLEILDLTNAGLRHALPAEFRNLTRLRSLTLGSDRADAALPPWLGELLQLEILNIRNSSMTGPIPPNIGNLINLEKLFVSDVPLRDSIPRTIGSLASLESLVIVSSQLIGTIPAEFGNLASLEAVDITHNRLLTGPIPPALGDLDNIRHLNLSVNHLIGPIPPEFGNLLSLEALLLSSNELTGAIPAELGNLKHLKWLVLDFNDLHGPIPEEIGGLTSLEVFRVSRNEALTGPVPRTLTRLKTLRTFVIDFTKLCVPRDSAFDAWLARIEDFKGSRCD